MRPAGRSRVAHLPRPPAVRRFAGQLRRPTRASALRSVVDGVVVAVSLRRHGARRLLARMRTDLPQREPARSMAVSEAVDAGLGLIPMAPTCLRRSVTLVRELNRLGLGAAIHVGVRRVADDVEAHAWVQVGDAVVNDDPVVTDTYATLAAGDLERLAVPLR